MTILAIPPPGAHASIAGTGRPIPSPGTCADVLARRAGVAHRRRGAAAYGGASRASLDRDGRPPLLDDHDARRLAIMHIATRASQRGSAGTREGGAAAAGPSQERGAASRQSGDGSTTARSETTRASRTTVRE